MSWVIAIIVIVVLYFLYSGMKGMSERKRHQEISHSIKSRKPHNAIYQLLPPTMQSMPWGDEGDTLIQFSKNDPSLSCIWEMYGVKDQHIKKWIEILVLAGADQTINGWNVVGATLMDIRGIDFLAHQTKNPKYPDKGDQFLFLQGECIKFISGRIQGFSCGFLFDSNGKPVFGKTPEKLPLIE